MAAEEDVVQLQQDEAEDPLEEPEEGQLAPESVVQHVKTGPRMCLTRTKTLRRLRLRTTSPLPTIDPNLPRYEQVRQIVAHKQAGGAPEGEVEQLNQVIKNNEVRVPEPGEV